ncbi:protein TIC 55, chloroplastic [Amborella trichopoda]|uniref:Rieske domain-containing protein n=1 Tax=Amborella trichopoda TaxID=13333 RepID=W1PB40_AMBTC|nr:protein TIC 55, chloroplastic [Amborella trichopoda]ERN07127.1 hypothetical protein AMTR_s00019p00118960 [Amborella trichopoda]|eukprot:XP_006845452.1 protein TIC 55, chloroplastic [Amborella trichopoda]
MASFSPLTTHLSLKTTIFLSPPQLNTTPLSPPQTTQNHLVKPGFTASSIIKPPFSKDHICYAVADVGHGVSGERKEERENGAVLLDDKVEEEEVAEYNWKEEWYPLYLSKDVPDDAPLGLTVFDHQLVLYRDGNGILRCHEDRCPHRLAKLSEGQLVDGRLECLYHGWQFEGEGECVKIPQLPAGAKIPRAACVKCYEVRDSQGVVWVWMSDKEIANPKKLPWFEHYDNPDLQEVSAIHELPYDHSILLENLMDPAHVPISHDRTDWTAKREDAQALWFKVMERTPRGFAGEWGKEKDLTSNFLRFEAPCVLQNNREFADKKGNKQIFSALFLCRPAGQGKSMLIVRFGATIRSPLMKILPQWYFHQNACKVFEQDMGFLSSQNEVLNKDKLPTKKLYINLKSSDTWVAEYRKWMDKVGHGMPYYFGHQTLALPERPALVEHAPAGLVAGIAASSPTKGGLGSLHVYNPTNRYFRHVIHCKGCRGVLGAFQSWKKAFVILALASASLAILASGRQWKALLLFSTSMFLMGVYGCSKVVSVLTTDFIRQHRRA